MSDASIIHEEHIFIFNYYSCIHFLNYFGLKLQIYRPQIMYVNNNKKLSLNFVSYLTLDYKKKMFN